nr:PIN domain protein [Bacteroidota bacterium]
MKTIYVDTSVFGGKFDPEFELWTDLFFQKVLYSDLKLIYSDIAEVELADAPQKVKDFVQSIPEKNILRTKLTEEAILLAENYLEEKIVS